MKIGPEETPKMPYLRFASVTLYPSNEDLSLAIGSILRSFSYPTASLVCAKAECESVRPRRHLTSRSCGTSGRPLVADISVAHVAQTALNYT